VNQEMLMEAVTLSSKYQIVIPQAVREKLRLKVGQKFQVLAYDGRIELVPVVPIQALRGILKGMEVPFKREKKDREL
jgi:AbrB family looped-hinge helix DNA binding protein